MLQGVIAKGITPAAIVMDNQIAELARHADDIVADMVNNDHIAVAKVKNAGRIVAKGNPQVSQGAAGCQGIGIGACSVGKISLINRAVNTADGRHGVNWRWRHWRFIRRFDDGRRRRGQGLINNQPLFLRQDIDRWRIEKIEGDPDGFSAGIGSYLHLVGGKDNELPPPAPQSGSDIASGRSGQIRCWIKIRILGHGRLDIGDAGRGFAWLGLIGIDILIHGHIGHPAQVKLGCPVGEMDGNAAIGAGNYTIVGVNQTVGGEYAFKPARADGFDCPVNNKRFADRLTLSCCLHFSSR